MATPNDQGAPNDQGGPERTPPLRLRGQALWRAFLIVSVFVFASSMLMMVVDLGSETWSGWWTELLVVPGFFLGLGVAIADFVRQRGRR